MPDDFSALAGLDPAWRDRDIRYFLADPWGLALRTAAKAVKAPPPADFLQWAVENVVFGTESSLPGPYDRELFPFFDEILRALSPQDPCRIVTFQKAAQIGGTVVAQIFIAAALCLDPCTIIDYHPSAGNAEHFKTNKWDPFVKNIPALKAILNTDGEKGSKSNNKQQQLKDLSGSVMFLTAASDENLSQHSARRIILDDLAKFEDDGDFGDAQSRAEGRAASYEYDAKIFRNSTPGIMPGCKVSESFREGTQEHWQVPCHHDGCGEYQELEWEQFRIDKEHLERSHFECKHCRQALLNHKLKAMNLKGRWVAKYPERAAYHRSFLLATFYSPLFSWERLAREWIAAEGKPEKEKQFMNERRGLAFEADSDTPDWELLHARGEAAVGMDGADLHRGTVPAWVVFLFAGVDVQGDRVEITVRGYGRKMRSHIVDYVVLRGAFNEEQVRDALKDFYQNRRWRDEWGNERGIDALGIDSGYMTDHVKQWAKKQPDNRVIVLKGTASEDYAVRAVEWMEQKKSGKPHRTRRRRWQVGTGYMKTMLYTNLKQEDPQAYGHVSFPRGLDPDYYQGLCSERRIAVRQRSGITVYQWKHDKTVANEPLDTANYAEAVARRNNIHNLTEEQWDQWEAERCKPPATLQGDLLDPARMAARPAPQPKPDNQPKQSKAERLAAALAGSKA